MEKVKKKTDKEDKIKKESPEKLVKAKKEEEDLKGELEEKKKEIEDLEERLLRTQADFENYKKRINRERADLLKFGNEELIKELLPVVDNLEKAIAHAKNSEDFRALVEGVEITLKEFLKALERFGLTGVPTIGEKFNPHIHEAVMQVETEEYQSNTIISELRKGYFLNGRLLRPALVSVAKPTFLEGEIED